MPRFLSGNIGKSMVFIGYQALNCGGFLSTLQKYGIVKYAAGERPGGNLRLEIDKLMR